VQEALSTISALFLTNALGYADDLPEIADLCRRFDVVLLEDNCESLGSAIGGKKLGNFGYASTFSFFAGHHLSTIEGGMVCTDREELRDQLVMARAHGWDRNLDHAKKLELRAHNSIEDRYADFTFYDLAFNVRPTDVAGFLGNFQLSFLDEVVSRRAAIFRKSHSIIANNPDLMELCLDHMSTISSFATPVICNTPELAADYRRAFTLADIETRPIIAGDITRQPFYRKYARPSIEAANSSFLHENGFYLSNDPELTEDELGRIWGALRSNWKGSE
jgi:CDP-6-deoxy-D-xylo-4-hexulose-3-dehydrase